MGGFLRNVVSTWNRVENMCFIGLGSYLSMKLKSWIERVVYYVNEVQEILWRTLDSTWGQHL